MKNRTCVSFLILIFVVMFISEGFATEKKVTKRDYRFFSGTWVNEEYNSHYFKAKFVIHRDGTFNVYNRTSDTGIYEYGHYIIIEKWIDSEGNIWFKQHVWAGTMVEGHPGTYELDKFSNNGKVWEYISLRGDFPTDIDKNHIQYHIYYRQE